MGHIFTDKNGKTVVINDEPELVHPKSKDRWWICDTPTAVTFNYGEEDIIFTSKETNQILKQLSKEKSLLCRILRFLRIIK